jgi:hypothetical protein
MSPIAMSVPEVVERGLIRCSRDYGDALNLPVISDAEQAQRADRLAAVCERRARWWGVLLRWVFSAGSDLSWIFGAALIDAIQHEQSSSRFWRQVAQEFRDVAEGRVVDTEHAEWM